MIRFIIGAIIAAFVFISPQHADAGSTKQSFEHYQKIAQVGMSLPDWPTAFNPTGGSPPAWAASDAQANEACGVVSSCNVTVTGPGTGFVIVGVGANTNGATLNSISFCGVSGGSWTKVADTGQISSSREVTIWGATVSSGCTGSQTLTIGGSFAGLAAIYVGVGVLTNLSSTTATSNCNGSVTSVVGGALACSSTITIPSSGFGICFGTMFFSGTSSFGAPFTTDKQFTTGTSGSDAIAHDPTAATITPSFSATTSTIAGLTCGTWH